METQIPVINTQHSRRPSRESNLPRQPGAALESNLFRLERRLSDSGERIWTAVFDLPGEKVNKLDRRVLEECERLLPELERLAREGEIDALVLLSGKPDGFIAGADIEMIRAAASAEEARELSRRGHQLLDRWEDLAFPTVAAIHGAALGGGCEFALACTAIVMSEDPVSRIGLPEVMLGLIPGMGGCIRLPQRVGLATALDLILTAKQLDARRAFAAGLIAATLPKESFGDQAVSWTRRHLPALRNRARLGRKPKLGGMGGKLGSVMEGTPIGRSLIFIKAREKVLEKTHGHYPAPLRALEVIRKAAPAYGKRVRGEARARAMAIEAEAFGGLAVTDVSRRLIGIFFSLERVKKINGVAAGAAAARPVRSAAVLGAGVMGGGIAQLFAHKDIPIRMKDLNRKALETGMKAVSERFQKRVRRGSLDARGLLQKLGRVTPTLDYQGFRSVELVVEAVLEKMDVKRRVLAELEGEVSPGCVLASNTSSLSITGMQRGLAHPERVVGMHFFNPVHRMPLVEVIRGAETSDAAVATVFELSKKLGKTPIVVKDGPGFLVNRLLAPYLNEALHLLMEGVPVTEIDQAMLDFGMPMGPMELIDEVGVDVAEKVGRILFEAFGARMQPPGLDNPVAASGRLGKKSGKGLYLYPEKGPKEADPKIYEVIGVKPRPGAVSAREIAERCVLPVINEAARCLEEGVVASAEDLDLGMIMGTGFAPFRGGPLRYADERGVGAVVEGLLSYEPRFGARFAPSAALLKVAESGKGFYG